MIKTQETRRTQNVPKDEEAEWIRCAISPGYFLDNYGWILDPLKGKIRFRLYSFQRATVKEFLAYWANIILKPRQMGISWLVAGFALWLCNFYLCKNVLIISIKDKTAKRLLDKVKFIYKNLPPFLKCGIINGDEKKGEIGTTQVIEFSTESRVESISTSEDAGRSEGLSLLIIDEAAFVRWLDKIWAAAFPTLSTGGMAIILSSANGLGNTFHKIWSDAAQSKNDFNPIRLIWQDYPGRDRKWYLSQLHNLGRDRCAQEVGCDFLQSGRPVFEISEVRALEECASTPVRQVYNGDLIYYAEPQSAKRYVIGADTADGDGESYQAAVVLDAQDYQQMVEYQSKEPIEDYAQILADLGREYNNAVIGVERNNMGQAVLVLLKGIYPEHLIYIQPTKQKEPNFIAGKSEGKFGFFTSGTNKPLTIGNLSVSVRQGESGIVGKRLIGELYTYVHKDGGKMGALEGYNDDLVMARAIAQEVIRTTLWSPRDLPVG